MAEFDAFSEELLEESRRFLEIASESENLPKKNAYLHASLMLALSALDARVNSIAAVQAMRTDLSPHERGVLLEREVYLENGEFEVSERLKMWRLEERIEFLCVLQTARPLDRSQPWWGQLSEAIRLRNDLTHPKTVPNITDSSVSRALTAVIDTFDALSKAVYKKGYPDARRGLASRRPF